MKLLCLGDSLTLGLIGYSYIPFLNKKYKCINKGINGDTTVMAYKRLTKYVKNNKYHDVDYYIISIGSNDLLLPYLSGLSRIWYILNNPRERIMKCLYSDIEFKDYYEKYLKLLKDNNKKVILIGLPKLELKDFQLEKIESRNRIIEYLANKYDYPFIDIYSFEDRIGSRKTFSWKHRHLSLIIDRIITNLFSLKDQYGRKRDLTLTIDGAHYNSLVAKLLANKIEEELDGR